MDVSHAYVYAHKYHVVYANVASSVLASPYIIDIISGVMLLHVQLPLGA